MNFHTIGKAALPFAMIAGLGMSQAQAADLGGDCCADLEERIAELEATTVRKGNRKVSLKLSGQINTALLYWDDGVDNDIYVVDNISSSTRFRMTGSAKISSDWSAGFHFEIEYARGGTSTGVTQLDDDGGQNGDGAVDVRRASWYLKSMTLGKLRVGQTSLATDDIGLIGLGGNGVVSNDTNLWGRVLVTEGNTSVTGGESSAAAFHNSVDTTSRSNAVRYDSPTLAGFTVSAAWGEDDAWDLAVRYAGELGPFRIAGGVGYFESNDDTTGLVSGGAANTTDSRVLGSLAALHTPTGLNAQVYFNFGDDDEVANQDTQVWGIRAGWYGKIFAIGKTSIFAGYGESDTDNNVVTTSQSVYIGFDTSSTLWEVGIVQKIDAAAMELYLAYKHYDFEIDGVADNVNDQDYVMAGGRIKF